MKISRALIFAQKKFEKFNSADQQLEAEILLSAALRKNREYLFVYPDKRISIWQNFIFRRMIDKRLKGYSGAAIIGHKWFYGLDFIVSKNVLIPRPETELMVDEAIRIIKNENLKIKNIIDMGTGSGCIIISLAKKLTDKDIKFWGVDISAQALRVARKNAKKNGVGGQINFLHSDLLDKVDKKIFNEPAVITANLPYLAPEQARNSPSIQKEPKIALLAGRDGLDCYRRLFKQIKGLSSIIKKEVFILCEIDETQKLGIQKLTEQELPKAEIKIINDFGGFARLAIVRA